jgi:hypothetical protein
MLNGRKGESVREEQRSKLRFSLFKGRLALQYFLAPPLCFARMNSVKSWGRALKPVVICVILHLMWT